METILGLILIITALAFLVVIGFGITLLTGVITKKSGAKNVGKMGLYISGGIFIVLLLGAGVSNGIYTHQLKVQAQQKSEMNRAFKKEAKNFKATYLVTAMEAEDVGNAENNSWGDAIDDNSVSDDDFDVDQTVSDIVDENSSDIGKAKAGLQETEKSLNKLKKNDTGTYSINKYNKSYFELRKMVRFVSSPSGSYSTFGDKFSDIDTKVSDYYQSL